MTKYKHKVLVCTQMFPVDKDSAIISGMIKNPFYQTLAVNKHLQRVDVITTGDSAFTGSVDDISVYSVGNGWLKGVFKAFIYETKIALKAIKLNKSHNYDVIHIHHLNIPIILLFKKLGLIKSKIIYTAHGTSTPELNAARQGSRLNHFLLSMNGRVQHFLDSFCWKQADLLLSPSQFQISEMNELYKVKTVPIETVYNGFQEEVYYRVDDESKLKLKEKYNIKEGQETILYVGRAAKKKGIDKLIEVMDTVVAQRPSVKLILVVGYMGRQTVYRDEIKSLAQTRDYIDYYESIPESQLNEVYNVADLSVFPSIGYESIPTVIYESIATGCPVLTQNAWGIPEVLNNFFVEENDILAANFSQHIIEILDDEVALKLASEEALQNSRAFSWTHGGEVLAVIYSKVLGSK